MKRRQQESEPLLFTLGAGDAPLEPVVAPEIVAEVRQVEAQRILDSQREAIEEAEEAAGEEQQQEWLGGESGRTDEDQQHELFDAGSATDEHWQGMPEFEQRNLMPWKSIVVHFRNAEDRKKFASIVDQNVTGLTKSIWYPAVTIIEAENKRYVDAREDKGSE